MAIVGGSAGTTGRSQRQQSKPKLSMCCWTESQLGTPDRKAAWHKDCVIPTTCDCPAHDTDRAASTSPGTPS